MKTDEFEQAVRDAIVLAAEAAAPDEEKLLSVQRHTLQAILQGAADAIAERMRTERAGNGPDAEHASSSTPLITTDSTAGAADNTPCMPQGQETKP